MHQVERIEWKEREEEIHCPWRGSGWDYIVQLADGGSSMDGNTTCGIAMTGLGLAAISCCFYAAVCLESAVVISLL